MKKAAPVSPWTHRLRYLALAATLGIAGQAVYAAAPTPTTITLAVTSGGGAVATAPAGSVVALTATVNAGGTAVSTGQVNFCDGSASSCTDIHLLGKAQLTGAGTAIVRFRPGIGNRSYKAVFAGTSNYAGSSSAVASLSVTGTIGVLATTTTLAETGSWGNYALTATVTESGGTLSPGGTVSFLDTANGNALLANPALGPAVAGVDWPNPQTLVAPRQTLTEAIGDFNGDGIPDVAAIAGPPQQPVVIFLGNADGSYSMAPSLSFDAYALNSMVVADFNSDGKQDLAVVNGDSNNVTVFLGNGDGTFNLVAASAAVAAVSTQEAVEDFNRDGIPDLVVTSYLSGSVTILLGNGDGTFTATPDSPVAGASPYGIALGDFNQDGKIDLAISDFYDDTVSVLLSHGDGTFAAATSVHSGSQGSPIVSADFNGDGKPDLAVAVSGAGGIGDTVTVLSGNGDGTFVSPPAGPVVLSGYITSLRVGDFNADGLPDVALTDNTSGILTAFLANGSGAWTAFSKVLPPDVYYSFSSAVGDINGDGRSDLIIGDDEGGPLAVYLTDPTETATASANLSLMGVGQHVVDASYSGDGNYTASVSNTLPFWGVPPATATTLTVSAGGNPVANVVPGTAVSLTATVAVGASPVNKGQVNFCDASAPACTDIHLLSTVTLTSGGTATFQFVPGAGTHSYKAVFLEDGYGMSSDSPASMLTVGPAPKPFYTDTATMADYGPEGYDTLTATVIGYGGTAAPTGTISFLDTSFGNVSLASAPLAAATAGLGWHISPTPAINPSTLTQVTGDFNGDGVPDLALLSAGGDVAAAITILFGKGDGTFSAGPSTQSTITSINNYPLVAADLNGDGKTDLALLSFSGVLDESLTTFLGNGDGTFAAPVTVPINQTSQGGDGVPGSLIAADFNGDGKIDLAAAGQYINQGGVIILLGKGDGTFNGPTSTLQAGLGFNEVATGDFNGDGIPDLVATQFSYPGGAFIFLGKGDGTFASLATTLSVQDYASSIVAGDFNQDGKLDLAFGYSTSGVAIELGNGDGTFNHASGTLLTGSGLSLSAGDFNHDGKLDLAGLDNYNDVIDLYLGIGDGTFTAVTTTPAISQDFTGPFSIVAADFNEDGVPDLAMLTSNQATASILLTEPTQTALATVNGITPVGTGTHNVVASYPGDANYASTISPPVALNATLAPVKISLNAGTYASAQTVTLSESVPGASIFYQLFGTVSTKGDVPYTGPIQLAEGGEEILYTYATETGYQQSSLTSATYYLNLSTLPAPVFSPAAGSYPGAQTVTITESVAGSTIYYTTDGSLPTAASAKYTGAVAVSSSETLVAIALVNGYDVSAVASSQYLIGSSPASFIYTIAGNGFDGYSGDGGLATDAQLNQPYSSVLDSAGNLYFTDASNNVVRKVAATTGVITTVVGNGIGGYSGDNGPAANAQLSFPIGLALDAAGNLYISDYRNNVIRKVLIATGVITTIAGNGVLGFGGDGGPATAAQLQFPWGLTFDTAGNLYIADGNDCVREVAAQTGVITTVAGNSQRGYNGDGGPATAAQLDFPSALATDSAGNLYIADANNYVIRKVNAKTGVITTVAGDGFGAGTPEGGGYTGDGGPATSAELSTLSGLALDSAGNLYIADANNFVIRKVTATSGVITTVAGNGSSCNSLGGDGGPPTSAGFCYSEGVTVDAAGNLYIADAGAGRVRQVRVSSLPPSIQAAAPVFSVGAGVYSSPQTVTISDSTPGAAIYVTLDGSTPSTASQGYLGPLSISGGVTVQAIAVAPGYIASAPVTAKYTIAEQPAAIITTAFGDGVSGFYNGGGSPRSAEFGSLTGIVIDGLGNIFFADARNNAVWEVTVKSGQISVVAGVGPPGTGDSQTQANVPLSAPAGLAVDSAGNLFIADTNNNVVRKVAAGTGLITVYAGGVQNGSTQNVGDGGPATSAQLSFPTGLAVDSAGNLYIADSNESRVRLVTASTGVITTVAGNGNVGFTGDGGLATSAAVGEPGALALDSNGNLYIAEPLNGLVRKVTTSTGLISTIAGYGNAGSSGDGGAALKAEINPKGLAVDAMGNLYLSDAAAIRVVSASTGIISKFAGNGYFGYSGDGDSATVAEMSLPQGIAFDASGNLYINDGNNYRVREVFSPAHAFVAPVITVTPASTSITTAQTLSVAVTVQSGSGNATPTGSLTLASGNYSAQQTLANGTATFSLAAGSLPIGANTLTATYTPDSASAVTYAVAGQTATVTVTNVTGASVASLTLTPSATAITNQQILTVAASVTGGSGQATPTGTVTLASGSYSSQQPLATGAASFKVPAGALNVATNTLTANYSGDSNYAATSGTTSITVVPLVVTVPTPPPVAAGSAATATVTFAAGSMYSGTLHVSCALTASPAGAQSVPTCNVNPASVMIAAGGAVTTTVTVNTTKSSSGSALNRWGGGGILALALICVAPRLRRRTALLLVVCGISVIGCGGGGNPSSGTPPINTPATTPGAYTFSVTATDVSNANVSTTAKLTITVQ